MTTREYQLLVRDYERMVICGKAQVPPAVQAGQELPQAAGLQAEGPHVGASDISEKCLPVGGCPNINIYEAVKVSWDWTLGIAKHGLE